MHGDFLEVDVVGAEVVDELAVELDVITDEAPQPSVSVVHQAAAEDVGEDEPGGTAWSTPQQVATDAASNPAFGTRADGNVLQLFYRATDNTIRVLTQDTGTA
ncbi:hypothetical protein [Streptomyces sp. NPDC088260]|uniref:hypothetical protein n=1 Tax=Streptomyces sp. NPDC088260 TaxID=3365850 RepID=UPI003805F3EA